MRGKDLSEFGTQVKNVSKKVLLTYTPEIELALGPAKVTFRAVPNRVNELEQENERV